MFSQFFLLFSQVFLSILSVSLLFQLHKHNYHKSDFISTELDMEGIFNLTDDFNDYDLLFSNQNCTLSELNLTLSDLNLTLSDLNTTLSDFNWTLCDHNVTSLSLNSTEQVIKNTPSPTTPSDYFESRMGFIKNVIDLIVSPSLSFIGLISNILSLIITAKSGFDKTHNILLLFIVLSGSFFLIGNMNIVNIICSSNLVPNHVKRSVCVQFDKISAYALYTSWLTVHYILTVAKMSLNIFPSFVIIEQVLAVFFPLKVRLVITPTRMLAACSTACVTFAAFSFIYYVDKYEVKMYTLRIVPRPPYTMAPYTITPYLILAHESHEIIKFIEHHIINNITGIIPILIVSIGTLITLLKIVSQTARRQKMTNSTVEQTSRLVNKATKTLLTLCILYCLTSLTQYLFGLLASYGVVTSGVSLLLESIDRLVAVLYCSCNLPVNYITNPGFRHNFRCMMVRWFYKAKPEVQRDDVTRSTIKSSRQ